MAEEVKSTQGQVEPKPPEQPENTPKTYSEQEYNALKTQLESLEKSVKESEDFKKKWEQSEKERKDFEHKTKISAYVRSLGLKDGNCTIISHSVNPETRLYEWRKTFYKDVYFETKTATNSNTESVQKGEKYCYCCIYGTTEIPARIGDIIVKGEISENIDITCIKEKYPAFSITSITPCDMGNTKHTEIEGC